MISPVLGTGTDTGGGAGLLDAHPEASTVTAARTVVAAALSSVHCIASTMAHGRAALFPAGPQIDYWLA